MHSVHTKQQNDRKNDGTGNASLLHLIRALPLPCEMIDGQHQNHNGIGKQPILRRCVKRSDRRKNDEVQHQVDKESRRKAFADQNVAAKDNADAKSDEDLLRHGGKTVNFIDAGKVIDGINKGCQQYGKHFPAHRMAEYPDQALQEQAIPHQCIGDHRGQKQEKRGDEISKTSGKNVAQRKLLTFADGHDSQTDEHGEQNQAEDGKAGRQPLGRQTDRQLPFFDKVMAGGNADNGDGYKVDQGAPVVGNRREVAGQLIFEFSAKVKKRVGAEVPYEPGQPDKG